MAKEDVCLKKRCHKKIEIHINVIKSIFITMLKYKHTLLDGYIISFFQSILHTVGV